jgi:hypothetical protein
MDDVAKETEVRYCTEYGFVYAEVTWTERDTITLGGLAICLYRKKSAEAIVGRKRAISRSKGKDGSLTGKPKG